MSDWLINDWFPVGHRAEDTAPEGSFKTIWGSYLSVNIATGTDILGHSVKQGPVLIIDNETPRSSLESLLNRFSLSLGYRSYHELPITIATTGFLFDRKTDLDKVLKLINSVQPVFIRLDSLVSMMPLGRQGINENSSYLGGVIGRDLTAMIAACSEDCSTLLAAHSKKYVAELSIEELETAQMQTLVRGHGSIVGEGADTGFILKKISEHPMPTRFAIITKARRQAIPAGDKTIYLELQEPSGYGKGPATLVEIPPMSLPPSEYAQAIYKLIHGGGKSTYASRGIVNHLQLFTKSECRRGIQELIEHRTIIEDRFKPQVYSLNPYRQEQCDKKYLEALLQ